VDKRATEGSLPMMDFTYEELQGMFRRVRRKALPKLWEYRKELQDPYTPFKTKILMYVPHPTLFAPFPCILVSIANPKSRMFFRIKSFQDLEAVFVLPADEQTRAILALKNAQEEAERLEAISKALEVSKDLAKSLSSLDQSDLKEIEAFLRQQRERGSGSS
jgi:predicted RNA-binding protein YlxR (DUF448 family)